MRGLLTRTDVAFGNWEEWRGGNGDRGMMSWLAGRISRAVVKWLVVG